MSTYGSWPMLGPQSVVFDSSSLALPWDSEERRKKWLVLLSRINVGRTFSCGTSVIWVTLLTRFPEILNILSYWQKPLKYLVVTKYLALKKLKYHLDHLLDPKITHTKNPFYTTMCSDFWVTKCKFWNYG
jgi:hypothetical protein